VRSSEIAGSEDACKEIDKGGNEEDDYILRVVTEVRAKGRRREATTALIEPPQDSLRSPQPSARLFTPTHTALQLIHPSTGTLSPVWSPLCTSESPLYELASLVTWPGSLRQSVHPDAGPPTQCPPVRRLHCSARYNARDGSDAFPTRNAPFHPPARTIRRRNDEGRDGEGFRGS